MKEEKLSQKITGHLRRLWSESGRGRWLVALSGGADSTSLLLACHKAGIPVEAAHCNFHLRGEESMRDSRFAENLCRKLDIPITVKDFDVTASMLKGESVEMACRRLRYQFFNELMAEKGIRRLAVGHNADDNAETLFLNLLRGSGVKGLKGMEEKSAAAVRPLLRFRRHELLEYLSENNQDYINDSTNNESLYRRNFLRNEVFPLLESRWEGFHSAVARSLDNLRRENRIVEHFLTETLRSHSTLLPWKVIREFPDPQTLIYRFIAPFGGTPLLAEEIARHALSPSSGKRWETSHEIQFISSTKGLKVLNKLDGDMKIPPVVWEKVNYDTHPMQMVRSASIHTIYLPFGPDSYEWIPANRTLSISPIGMRGSQKVWKVLKDAGISVPEREKFAVLIEKESGEPIWLPGVKRSRHHLLTGNETEFYHIHP